MATKYGIDAVIEWAKIKGRSRGIRNAIIAIVVIGVLYMVMDHYVFT